MRVVVVGGNGFIGTNLVRRLKQDNFDVVCCDKFDTGRYEEGVEYHIIQSDDQYQEILQPDDTVFYLQWNGVPMTSVDVITETLNNNIVSIVGFLEICRQKKVKRFIFSSSGGTVYGIPEVVPIVEDHRLRPISSYGIQKVTAEHYIQLLGRQNGIETLILRISNPYGPGQRAFSGQGVIATYLASALTGATFTLRGDGEEIRDYIYIDDLSDALVRTIDYNGAKTVFNIGSGEGYSLKRLIEVMDTVLSENHLPMVKKEYIPKPSTDVTCNVLDCSLAEKELFWSSDTQMHVGVQRMLESWNPETGAFEVG